MKYRNLFLSLLTISFVLYFGLTVFAQRPTASPTGSGDSTKPRPKDVSPTEVKKVLDAVKIPNSTTNSTSNITPTITTPKPTPIIFDPTNPPDLTGTKWYSKFKYQNRLIIVTVVFDSEGKIKKEILGDGIILISGIWRQVGRDVFVSWNNTNGTVSNNCQLQLGDDGAIYGTCKSPSDGKLTEDHLISDNLTFYYSRGLAYSNWGEVELSIRYYTKAIESGETHPNIYIWRAYSYYQVEKYDLAISDYSKFIENEKIVNYFIFIVGVYEMRGACYLKIKDYQKAISDFTNAIEKKDSPFKSKFALTARIVAYEAIDRKDLADADRKTIADFATRGRLTGEEYK
ncbi:MAG TPA: tetratricopeptide repeat protein [Pyrinomonadaceae bacterium]|nr:tetratricopeptide repeat protein [Pyrinomonadaceae bacterium]